MPSSFLDRFQKLEIPEARRRVDWSFLDAALALPEPLPLADRPLLVLLQGRALEPVGHLPDPDGDSLIFYRDPVALVAREEAAAAEAAWEARHEGALAREARRWLDGIPTEILRERQDEAREILQLNAPPTSLLAGERLLRIHGKLYNLVTLQDYTRIFEKAIDPGLFRELVAMPATCTPAEMLAKIAASLPLVHKKARSPLRNKMECARAVIGGVTLLPIYREPAAALWDAWRRLLERRVKVAALGHHES